MTLVLLHGFMGSAEGLRPLANGFAASLGHDNVVAVDLVGHGTAPSPTEVSAYAMKAVVHDAALQIRDVSKGSPVDLFGYSMGGRVALSLAIEHPELVRRLVVLGASPGLREEAERQERQTSDGALADTIERDGVEAFVSYWLGLPMFQGLRSLGEDWFQIYEHQRFQNNPVGIANALRGYGTGAMPPLHGRLAEMLMPVLFAAGSLDTKFADIGATLATSVPAGTFVSIDDAGHAAHLEAQPALVDAVSSFLQA